jgi:DeoR/GlpR family transcriptional regulator of sugar metabolism
MESSEGRDVFARERQQHIARTVEEHGRVRVADLAGRFEVSEVTIRKDLRVLESEGRVVRAHGGALAPGRSRPERAFEVRERLQRTEKQLIGVAAADLVVDGESIALDASTTALAMARALTARGGWMHLTVITNGLRIASELAGRRGITVAMPGGFVRSEALSVVGPLGSGLLERVNIQKAFMGAAGFTLETGLSDATDEEAQIKRLMVGSAREVVAVIDHTKWGRTALATFCPTDMLTAVVTDGEAPAAMADALRERRIVVHVATRGGAPPAPLSGASSDSTVKDTHI